MVWAWFGLQCEELFGRGLRLMWRDRKREKRGLINGKSVESQKVSLHLIECVTLDSRLFLAFFSFHAWSSSRAGSRLLGGNRIVVHRVG